MDTANKIAAFMFHWHARLPIFYISLHPVITLLSPLVRLGDRQTEGDHNYVSLSQLLSVRPTRSPPKGHELVSNWNGAVSVGQSLIYSPRNKFNCRTIFLFILNDMTYVVVEQSALFYVTGVLGSFKRILKMVFKGNFFSAFQHIWNI